MATLHMQLITFRFDSITVHIHAVPNSSQFHLGPFQCISFHSGHKRSRSITAFQFCFITFHFEIHCHDLDHCPENLSCAPVCHHRVCEKRAEDRPHLCSLSVRPHHLHAHLRNRLQCEIDPQRTAPTETRHERNDAEYRQIQLRARAADLALLHRAQWQHLPPRHYHCRFARLQHFREQ